MQNSEKQNKKVKIEDYSVEVVKLEQFNKSACRRCTKKVPRGATELFRPYQQHFPAACPCIASKIVESHACPRNKSRNCPFLRQMPDHCVLRSDAPAATKHGKATVNTCAGDDLGDWAATTKINGLNHANPCFRESS